ncbi:MAG: diguanylate cyclase (GGDEF)-like protein [Paraglaciecola sp.]|jgi:diguanylate cyclase (GGDEF)-like protein
MFGFSFDEAKLTWWLVLNALLLLRIIDTLEWYFHGKKIGSDSSAGIRRFSAGVLLTALCWSAYIVFFFEKMDVIEFATTLVIICAMAGGSSTVLIGSGRLAATFSLILLLPVSIYCLNSPENYRQYLGILGIIFGGVISYTALKIADFTNRAPRFKNQNLLLIEQMKQEKSEIARVNKELSETSDKLNQANNNLEQDVQKRNEKIYQLNNLDPLTNLMNRNAFTAELAKLTEKSTQNKTPLALLFIDLEGFKKINDTLGHQIGDSVLIEVAARINAFADDNKSGRWGGDEFLVALPYSDQETAIAIASAIITRISQPIHVHDNEVHLGAAVGIVMCPEHNNVAAELIQLADLAMCDQKETGTRNPRVFSVELKRRIESSQKILDGLQHAIERQQLYLCFQPIQCANDKGSWSFEALLRWDFDGTFVGPDVFIPLAEKSGLIKDIGAWVLNRACMDASQWQYGQHAAVSVNVSVIQLMDDGFIRILDNALRSSGLPPERLHLELTESVFVDNEKKIRQQLDAIQARNIHVSIDDFGTGYSSLSQLQTLNVNYVKIDKSFVDNMKHKGEAIIRATLFIARELNCKTIAEGVESKEQALALSAMGVDYLQGYYFAKPMKNDDLIIWQNPITHQTP